MDSNISIEKAPVMLLFFNRPDCLRQVFEAVKKYKPKKLFLIQDGPREGRSEDLANILACRKIVEDISWDCEIHRNYSENNMGCDYREYSGIDWCFQLVDRLIILEDDCIPSDSFFKLCEECLERYKSVSNIHSIAGFNRVGIYKNSAYDYVFSKTGAGWGWATWKRTWDLIKNNQDLLFLDDPQSIDYINHSLDKSIKRVYGDVVGNLKKVRENDRKSGHVTSWENLAGLALVANDMLVITPKKNMIKYIGITKNATHIHSNPKFLPYKISKVLLQPSYELDAELVHPPFIIRDKKFELKSKKSMQYPPYFDRLEVGIRKILFGYWKKPK